MTPLLPAALTSADLPLTELHCARLDGEVFEVAGAWCPVDAHDGPETRAAALVSISPRHAVAERMTAAWVYGLTAEPNRHQFCVDVSARTRKPLGSSIELREVRLGVQDARALGPQLITTALRTAIDLARWGRSPGCPADTALLAALLAYDGIDGRPDDALYRHDPLAVHRGISFSRVAVAQLTEALRLARRLHGGTPRWTPPWSGEASAVADPVDVVDSVDPAHGVQHPVEVGGVAHLEHELADRQPVAGRVHRRREDVDVVL